MYKRIAGILFLCILCLRITQVQAATIPDIPKVSGCSTKNGVILRWSEIKKDADGYEIQYAADKNFINSKTLVVKKNSVTCRVIRNLEANKTFYFRIRAYSNKNNQIMYGSYSKTVSASTAGKVAYFYKDGFYYEKISTSVKKRITGKSYKKNKYVSLSDLRYVRVQHYGYDGTIKSGELIVNKKIAKKVVKIFYELYKIKYPIQRMELIDKYDADDVKSMEANNTSAFNFRTVSGTSKLSKHAYGLAIDLNPRINPYVRGNYVSPKNGKVYKQRNLKLCKGVYKTNMIHKNDKAYKIFKKYGFSWGGNWRAYQDYQHFQYDK